MQCPVCGVTARNNDFGYIGSGKRICASCQSILHVGYLCPVCESFTAICSNPSVPGNKYTRFLSKVRFTFNPRLGCDNCGYQGSYRLFRRIIYQDDKFSMMD